MGHRVSSIFPIGHWAVFSRHGMEKQNVFVRLSYSFVNTKLPLADAVLLALNSLDNNGDA
jgi:hypothetical protein